MEDLSIILVYIAVEVLCFRQ